LRAARSESRQHHRSDHALSSTLRHHGGPSCGDPDVVGELGGEGRFLERATHRAPKRVLEAYEVRVHLVEALRLLEVDSRAVDERRPVVVAITARLLGDRYPGLGGDLRRALGELRPILMSASQPPTSNGSASSRYRCRVTDSARYSARPTRSGSGRARKYAPASVASSSASRSSSQPRRSG
jgi:hypothetical protein